MGKRRNQNFCWFGFRHVPISDVWAQTERIRFDFLVKNGLNVQNLNNFVWFWMISVQKSNSLIIIRILDIEKCPKTKQNCLDFGQMPKTEPTENGTEVTCSDFGR